MDPSNQISSQPINKPERLVIKGSPEVSLSSSSSTTSNLAKVVFISKAAHYSFKNLGHTPLKDVKLITTETLFQPRQMTSSSSFILDKNEQEIDNLSPWIHAIFDEIVNRKKNLSATEISLMVSASPLKNLVEYFKKLPAESLEDRRFLIRFLDATYEFYPDALNTLSSIDDNKKKQLAEYVAITSRNRPEESDQFPYLTLKHPFCEESRYLKEEIACQIFDKNIRTFSDRYARYSNTWFSLKTMPERPLMDYAVHNLSSRLGKALTPYTQLLRLEVVTDEKPVVYPLLMSETIPGPNSQPNEELKDLYLDWDTFSTQQKKHWTQMFLFSVLAHPRNYVLDARANIFCIDNATSFSECMIGDVFDFNSIAFKCFKDVSLDAESLEMFSTLNPETLLEGWLNEVIKKEEEYSSLFDLSERRTSFDSSGGLFSTEIIFKEGVLSNLFLQFVFLQDYIKRRLTNSGSVSPLQLLEQIISLKFYPTTYNPIGYHLMIAIRGNKETQVDLLRPAVKKDPLIFEQLEHFSAKHALEELIYLLKSKRESSSEKSHLADLRQQRIALAISLIKEIGYNRVLFEANIDLSLLNPNTLDLNILNCQELTDQKLEEVQKKSPNLKKLQISNCSKLKQPKFRNLKQLEILSLENCSQLTHVESHELHAIEKIFLFNNVSLRTLSPAKHLHQVSILGCSKIEASGLEQIDEELLRQWLFSSSDQVPLFKSLRTIFLLHQTLNLGAIDRLCESLYKNPNITRLLLIHTNINDLHVERLLSIFKSREFDAIDLSNNQISFTGAEKITDIFKQRPTTSVNLKNNSLTEEQITSLKRSLGPMRIPFGISL